MNTNTSQSFHETALRAVNEALTVLGQDQLLEKSDLSIDAEKVNGRKCAYLYDGARKKVLREHPWNFARRGAVVASSPISDDDGFTTALPGGSIRILDCIDEAGRSAKYRIYGREIRSTSPLAKVVYVADVENLDRWTPDAYRTLILRLAADLAKPITGRINERQLQEEAYAAQLAEAKLADSRESNAPENPYGGNYYLDAMRGGADWRRDRSPFSPFSRR